MQQTLLALCAVAIFSIYALNSTRDEAVMDRRSVTSEVERAAEAIAKARLADVERRSAFDEQDVGRTSGIRNTPPTSVIGPDAGEVLPADFDDLDDFNALAEARTADGISGLVLFDVTYRVRYVQPTGGTLQPSGTPTLSKEVTVTVTEDTGGRQTRRPPTEVTLSRVYTPAGMTSFRR